MLWLKFIHLNKRNPRYHETVILNREMSMNSVPKLVYVWIKTWTWLALGWHSLYISTILEYPQSLYRPSSRQYRAGIGSWWKWKWRAYNIQHRVSEMLSFGNLLKSAQAAVSVSYQYKYAIFPPQTMRILYLEKQCLYCNRPRITKAVLNIRISYCTHKDIHISNYVSGVCYLLCCIMEPQSLLEYFLA